MSSEMLTVQGDAYFMKQALLEAKKGFEKGELKSNQPF